MFAEVAAYAKSKGVSLVELLDQIYEEFGYYLERAESIYMEGADGAAKIQKLANSYCDKPPASVADTPVAHVRNFFNGDVVDAEGDQLPAEKMVIIELEDGRSFAVRPSGTEPKIKYYLFGNQKDVSHLDSAKASVSEALDQMWSWIQKDIDSRAS